MNVDECTQRFREEQKRPPFTNEWCEVLPKLTRLGSTKHGWAQISFSDLTSEDADEVITEQVAFFRAMNQTFEWTLFAWDQPKDLSERLKAHGFEIGRHEAVMIYDLHEAPIPHSEIKVKRVTDMEGIRQFRGVAEAVFGKEFSRTSAELAEHIEADSTEHIAYVAFDGDQPVSIGRLYTNPNSAFGGLYGGGTLPSHRSKGYYRAMIAARATAAVEFGARYLRVDALPTSRPILERLGFTRLTDTWPCDFNFPSS